MFGAIRAFRAVFGAVLLLAGSAKGGGMAEKAESIADFELAREYEGRACKLYFFKGWSGYSHPVHLRDPLTWAQALEREGHSQATFCDLPWGRALVHVRGLGYRRTPWQSPVPSGLGPGAHYFALPSSPAVDAPPGPALKPLEAALAAGYVLVRVGGDGKVELAERREVRDWYTYAYAYSPAGVIQRAIITNDSHTTTLDF